MHQNSSPYSSSFDKSPFTEKSNKQFQEDLIGLTHQEAEALKYHYTKKHGKLEVVSSKPCKDQNDLSLAYSPGVVVPCIKIKKNIDRAYQYTNKGNLVGVISNGTAVLGLGDIGAHASKPVMEGKAVLFKRFAGLDAFDIEIDAHDPERFIEIVKALEPTFGGINLEDIAAPESFYIEKKLQTLMDIPVFHDDQHGTAVVSSAALLNALEIVQKNIQDIRCVFSGAGAAALACAGMYVHLGMKKENMIFVDSQGVIYQGRENNMDMYKSAFAAKTTHRTLKDAIVNADVFVGLSTGNVLTKEMLESMNSSPIVFAMANPHPEIDYDKAKKVRPDVIIATGRSDYPNQVNNVLGFPFLFRAALDVRATCINHQMKIAAVHALRKLAKEPIPHRILSLYQLDQLEFGPDYLIPKPFDFRLLRCVSLDVAVQAMQSGVARLAIIDLQAYGQFLDSIAIAASR